ncbi:MAG TPA: MBL fold metallo-hydrolase [Phycisphaerae bacterium]|nr:MBL fold metallo-hydrolase [Phycisphaerae bacterium]
MEIHPFVLGSMQVSAYVVTDGGDTMIVDGPEGAEQIVAFCNERGLTPQVLVNTHGHADHIQGNRLLKETWPEMALAIGKGDAPMLRSPTRNMSILLGAWLKSPEADLLLADGDRVSVGSATFEVLATPGHSPGGISLYASEGPDGRPVVFSGDALFAGGIGRTDFPGANHNTLIESIKTRLLALPPETIVYPGHGPASTVAQEAATNPWL